MKIRRFLQKYFIISRQNRFFRIFGKTGSRIRNFFGLKPSRGQDGANKKKFSQIGPAVLEEIGHKQTSCCYIIEIYLWHKDHIHHWTYICPIYGPHKSPSRDSH